MKKIGLLLNIGIGIFIVVIISLVIYKFIIPSKKIKLEISMNHFEKITVIDSMKNEIKLADLVNRDESTFCLLYEINNCYSCINKGIEDMKALKNAGKRCAILVVHNSVDEVNGQAGLYDFSPFFTLKKSEFYEYFNIPMLPAVIQVKNGKIESGRLITP